MRAATRRPIPPTMTIGDVLALPPLIKPATAARIAAVSEETIVRLCKRGAIRAGKVGGRWRVNTAAFLAYAGVVADAAPASAGGPVTEGAPEAGGPLPDPYSVDLSDLLGGEEPHG